MKYKAAPLTPFLPVTAFKSILAVKCFSCTINERIELSVHSLFFMFYSFNLTIQPKSQYEFSSELHSKSKEPIKISNL